MQSPTKYSKIEDIPNITHPKNTRFINLTGRTSGRYTVIKYAGKNSKNREYWWCQCSCYSLNIKKVRKDFIISETVFSCGCIVKELHHLNKTTHGMSYSNEYQIWADMKTRCLNSKNFRYKDYGGRGIKICDRWIESFENFYSDMGPRPSNEHSIDRRYNDGDYCPENCYWATKSEQYKNRRTNRFLTFKDETLTVTEWAFKLNICPQTLFKRIKLKWNIEDILSKKDNNVFTN